MARAAVAIATPIVDATATGRTQRTVQEQTVTLQAYTTAILTR